ncbi:MAG: Proline--tRNA ligase [Chloroflexi bacterium ADurb.Bin325]|nr:MAG: Proline--tRNA ligase [Chloroflexi bacterium ADurb.Bin325]
MRMSRLFSRTLREAPADAEVISHQLLLRAGFIRQLGAGIFSYLPLARRSLSKIEAIMRQEIDAIGGQELTMPVVHPADLWQETGRWYQIGSEMGRFKDKSDHDMVLAMTHEEVVAGLARSEIRSYRQLPCLVYHIQTKWRDDPRPRGGLIRVREFTMLDSYSLDADFDGLVEQYRRHYTAYFRIFGRCRVPALAVQADVGMMGGRLAHEFMYLTPIGEDTLILCDACGYTANRQVATFGKPQPEPEAPLPIERVATPHTSTISDLAAFLGVPESRTAKAVFMMGTIGDAERFIFAVIRGDMEVNETKLANAVQARDLRPATEAEIRSVGATPGYASPLGLRDVLIIVDDLIPQSPNLVAGANEEGYHLRNTNYGRDYVASIVADIAVARDGDPCAHCSAALRTVRGVEIGNIFQLGTRYTDALGASYLDAQGRAQPIVMGSYGIGVGRLLACIAEEHHDEHGLIWPVTVAPFHVHLILLQGAEAEADAVYRELTAAGIEVLFDDRSESAGVKFADADLLGMPLRITLGKRSLKEGGAELKRRDRPDKVIVPLAELAARVSAELAALEAEVAAEVSSPVLL